MKKLLLVFILLGTPAFAQAAQVAELKVTVLSTMLADSGIGEWGYAALVEVDGRKILFDTGARPDTVLINARELGVELGDVEEVILSHHHGDHTGGLLTLRNTFKDANPDALSRVHVAAGFFLPGTTGFRPNLAAERLAWEAAGITFIVHDGPAELLPGVWLTGPVPRHTDEANYPPGGQVQLPGGPAPDIVQDDQALVFDTADGVVVLTGCGHSGVINIVDYARELTGAQSALAVIGGLHIFNASDARIDWTGEQLKVNGVRYLLLGHCTGVESALRLRDVAGLSRATAGYGATGSTFVLGEGIDSGQL
jgi:7,8-dihydropterin-6-yl-methyl-4-(beta-D-ribofuranosyl)aminobenzene 5'-phosphate synthase